VNKDQVLIEKVGIYLDMNQSIVLTMDDPGHISTIIDAAIKDKKDTHRAIKIDMLKMSTLKDIADSIMDQTNTFLDQGQNIEEFYDKNDDYKYLCYALELPEEVAKTINFKIIFIIDELEHVASFETDIKIQEIMRSVFQHQHNVVHIFTGTSKTLMRNVFHDRHAPFFRFATKIE